MSIRDELTQVLGDDVEVYEWQIGLVYDLTPDDCWRCDTRPATTEVGLCHPCHRVLSAPEGIRGQHAHFVILDECAGVR
jgi:hypothetical protein